jgi:hypothetical protein
LRRDPWSDGEKVSDEFLPSVFSDYFASLKLDNRMNKSNFHPLVEFILPNEIHPELVRCLDLIANESADTLAKAT